MTTEELKIILKLHLLWLKDNSTGQRADLSNANLSNAKLSFANLSFADLSNARLYNANLSFANLSFANLSFANLSFANLSNANLSFANLSNARLDKRYIQISRIGSRNGMTTYCFDDDFVWCGCFRGTLKEFERIVNKTHKNNPVYLKEYAGFIKYLKNLK